MNKSQAKKIQHLITKHLLDCGDIKILLPDGVTLEVGITQDTKHGTQISNDYCCVKASRDGRATMLDTYNLALEFAHEDEKDAIVYEDSLRDEKGRLIKRVDLV